MAKKTIKKEIRKIALQYRRTVEDAGIPIEKMLVFGSYARGNAREDSDIDICVVSPKLGKDEMVESSRLNFLHWKLDKKIMSAFIVSLICMPSLSPTTPKPCNRK